MDNLTENIPNDPYTTGSNTAEVESNESLATKDEKFNGTNESATDIHKKDGIFNSQNVMLQETAINELVLRVHLSKSDELAHKISTTPTNKRKKLPEETSSFGRRIKKKKLFEDTLYFPKFSDIQYYGQIKSSLQNRTNPQNKNVRSSIGNGSTKPIPDKNVVRSVQKLNVFPELQLNLTTPKREKHSAKISKVSLQVVPDANYINKEAETCNYLSFKKMKIPVDGKLNYSFKRLIHDIRKMQLPSSTWKIKIIIRKKEIANIIFTNKQTPERSVSFSASSDVYEVVIDDKPVILLGSPKTVDNIADIEVLLDIVQTIQADNLMVFYK